MSASIGSGTMRKRIASAALVPEAHRADRTVDRLVDDRHPGAAADRRGVTVSGVVDHLRGGGAGRQAAPEQRSLLACALVARAVVLNAGPPYPFGAVGQPQPPVGVANHRAGLAVRLE
jgi:hypothetical protein